MAHGLKIHALAGWAVPTESAEDLIKKLGF